MIHLGTRNGIICASGRSQVRFLRAATAGATSTIYHDVLTPATYSLIANYIYDSKSQESNGSDYCSDHGYVMDTPTLPCQCSECERCSCSYKYCSTHLPRTSSQVEKLQVSQV
jgi:hypothetical protein